MPALESGQEAAPAENGNTPNKALRFTVALSRELGTQGSTVAHEVGGILGWHVYDHEVLERIVLDVKLRNALLNSVDERRQSCLGDIAEAILSAPVLPPWAPPVTKNSYVFHLIKTVLALGVHGECVIVGRGAAFILRAESTLRVRLVAPVGERVGVLSRRLRISAVGAAKQIRTVDRERADFVQDHFFMDPNAPQNFDLVLNGTRLSVRHNAELIVEALIRLRSQGGEYHRAGRAKGGVSRARPQKVVAAVGDHDLR